MTELTLRPIATAEEKRAFITEIQQAFQQSFEAEFGKYDKPVLPEEDIEESFAAEGAESYLALAEGQRVGGAIVVPEGAGKGSLHLLYVRPGAQNAGYGHRIWREIERTHPSITLWETHPLLRQTEHPFLCQPLRLSYRGVFLPQASRPAPGGGDCRQHTGGK